MRVVRSPSHSGWFATCKTGDGSVSSAHSYTKLEAIEIAARRLGISAPPPLSMRKPSHALELRNV